MRSSTKLAPKEGSLTFVSTPPTASRLRTIAVWSSAVVISACTTSSDRQGEATDQSREALSGAGVSNDVDSPEANAVVRVGTCSGTLLTAQIALTAVHCIWGYEWTDTCNSTPIVGKVGIGPIAGPEFRPHPPRTATWRKSITASLATATATMWRSSISPSPSRNRRCAFA